MDRVKNVQGIKVISFNILAPCWASPSYYPDATLQYLDRVYRRNKIIDFLQNQNADIIMLQEVTQTEFGYINNSLKTNYSGFMSLHSSTYWSNWITVNPPWEPNGNAIFLNKARFKNIVFSDIALSDDGNHAAYTESVDSYNNNKLIRAVSIHLDSDHASNRNNEFNALMSFMKPSNSLDIIGGDFNIDVQNSNLKVDINKNGYINTLYSLGITDPTSPYSTTYYRRSVYGAIDTILIRNSVPQTGSVYSFNLYNLYPDLKLDSDRITENMKICGSDHFPVGTVINP